MTLLYLLDMIGTAAFAASGAWAGVRREMDLLGVLILGMVTAIGGGTLRDMLLGDTPPFCLKDENYLWLSLIVSLLVFFGHRHLERLKHPLLYFDAVGLGTFVVIGTGKALQFNLGPFGAVLMGIMTATAGGVIRDVLSNRVPLILQREIYASACLIGAGLMVSLSYTALPQSLIFILAASSVILLRLLAINNNWALPKAQLP
ncbi:trimeric intracellular cation channel family protein [Geopsychrobacter electrodiphilus]|uniref:trimeric intracellular cation channel family protein n=1 Tax=Geopsychrobacter electrodiphilus TaxID=225196 RepID=UPI00037D7A04|nr:trimeric intracellular cation channel family protein [Geopsychrobacter electrodiphilus]